MPQLALQATGASPYRAQTLRADPAAQILEDGIATGAFRSVNIKMVAFGVLDTVNWTLPWFSADGPFSSQELIVLVADRALHRLVISPKD